MTKPKYLVWQHVKPQKSDAYKLRQIWEQVKDTNKLYRFRRKLARDYWVAKTAKD